VDVPLYQIALISALSFLVFVLFMTLPAAGVARRLRRFGSRDLARRRSPRSRKGSRVPDDRRAVTLLTFLVIFIAVLFIIGLAVTAYRAAAF